MTRAPWPTSPLGELVDVLDGRRVPVSAAERAKRPGVVPYYGATGQVDTIDQALFNEPLLLLGEDGVQFFDPTRPKAYLIDGPAWVNNHAHVLRVRGLIDRRFLRYFLNYFDYRGYANGTTRLKLTQAAMKKIPVLLPPLEEQQRIVAILDDHLSRLDAATAYLDAARRRARTWKEATADGLIWGPGFETWRVGDLLREPMRNGRSDRVAAEGKTRCLTLTAVTRNEFTEENTKLTSTSHRAADGLWLEPGDIFVQRSNTPDLVGTTARFDGPRNWAIFPDLLIRLRPDEEVVDGRYLCAALRAERTHRTLRARAKGLSGSMPKIDQATIAETLVPLPPRERQADIIRALDEFQQSFDILIAAVERENKRTSSLRRSLLAAAFAGELTSGYGPEEGVA
ncbi:MAG: hypothetical protein EOL89_03945 [Actinobacteria bacterium]|nr:hypothetical protein [Actinomycetota bacterium]